MAHLPQVIPELSLGRRADSGGCAGMQACRACRSGLHFTAWLLHERLARLCGAAMHRFRSWPAILPLLLAALAMRALVPAGWMLDVTEHGVLQLRICSPQAGPVPDRASNQGAHTDMDHGAMDHGAMGHAPIAEHDGPDQPLHPAAPQVMDGLCAFAVAGAQALAAAPPELSDLPQPAAVALASWQAAEAPRIALRLRPPGRAPPARA
ncbi:hypothetical protein [Paraurantiacibacter namhicola]|nr:hypothetical protein [Paraurantiacibacter namhicola]